VRLAALNLKEDSGSGSGWSQARIGDFRESQVSSKLTGFSLSS